MLASRSARLGSCARKLTRAQLPHVARARLASVPARTPERTAELERLAEEHNGFLFGEVPPPEGQERVKEDWEYYFPQMMAAGFVIWGFIYVNQPYSCVEDWAMEEAKRRIALREAEEA